MFPQIPSIQTSTVKRFARIAMAGFALTIGASAWLPPSSVAPTPTQPSTALPDKLDVSVLAEALHLGATNDERLRSTDPRARQEAVDELVAVLETSWPDDHRRAFLVKVTPGALEAAVTHCVPPSVTVAQAVLESGWGRSGLARHGNLFGIKSGARRGGVSMKTREVQDGRSRLERARFATFKDWSASIEHHNRLLDRDPRYASARVHWAHWPLFLEQLAPVYASDPAYVSRVRQLVRDYRLDAWDQLIQQAALKHADCTWPDAAPRSR